MRDKALHSCLYYLGVITSKVEVQYRWTIVCKVNDGFLGVDITCILVVHQAKQDPKWIPPIGDSFTTRLIGRMNTVVVEDVTGHCFHGMPVAGAVTVWGRFGHVTRKWIWF